MKFIKLDLLTLLVSLFILGSCQNPTGIGLDVDPNIAIESKLIDTSTVLTKLQKQDSIVTNYTDQTVLGYFNDPVLGKTTASIAVGLTMPKANFTFGTNPVLDSAILVLPYNSFYGDSLNASFAVEVRQLAEALYNETNKSYYSTKVWQRASPIIGSKTIRGNYRDSIILQNIRKGLTDTVKKVPGQLRIKLDPSFVQNNIVNLDSLKKISNLIFNNYIKGLIVSVNKGATTGQGGLFSFDTKTAGSARIDIFYKSTNTTGTIDTLLNTFAINGINGDAATELNWDITGTAVKTELESTTNNNSLLYFKGLGGTRVRVDFPYIQKLKALGDNVAVNRAELVFTVDGASDAIYKPIPTLKIFRWDIAQRMQRIPDDSPNDPRFLGPGFVGGFYNTNKKTYTFNVTGYVQDLIAGKITNYGTFIMPSEFVPTAGLNNLERSILGGGNNPNYQVKLRVFYTNLK